jgi:hypothetical protein
MPQTVAAAVQATKAQSDVAGCQVPETVTTRDKSVARRCLQQVIAESGIAQKALAIDVLGRDDEPMFSKMVGGTRPFDINDLCALPRPVLVAWVKRFCREMGLTEPRELELAELTDDLLTQIERLFSIAKLARLGKARQMKARL